MALRQMHRAAKFARDSQLWWHCFKRFSGASLQSARPRRTAVHGSDFVSVSFARSASVRLMSSISGSDGKDGEDPEVHEVELPAGALLVGDVSKEAGMEELLRAARGGGGGIRVARRCHGCGAWLHSNNPEEHGYVPEEARERFSLTGRRKDSSAPRGVPVETVPDGVEVMRDSSLKYKDKTRLLVCQRCYKLQHYHKLDTFVKGGFYRMEGGRDWEHEAGCRLQ